jgi:phage baseplate assembly protein W
VSGHTFHLPARPAVGAIGGARDEELFGLDVLFDGDYHVGANGDSVLLDGEAALRQALRHRLITTPGDFATRPEYGCGVLAFVKEEMSPAALQQLALTIKKQIPEEPRVDAVLGVDLESPSSGRLTITILVRAKGKAIRMTFHEGVTP